MDLTHLHLILCHFPILGSAFGAALLFSGLFRGEASVIKAGLITLIISAVIAIPVFQTGEAAEESLEKVLAATEEVIDRHEETAEWAIWLMEFLGLLSLIGLLAYIRGKRFAKALAYLILILDIGVFGIFAYVGNLGGEIRHTEIRKENKGTEQDLLYQNEYSDDKNDDHDD